MNRDVALSAVLLLAVGVAVAQTLSWPSAQARMFPLAVGVPLLLMLAVQLVLSIRSARRSTVAVGEAAGAKAPAPESTERAEAPGALSLTRIVVWLLAFAVVIWLLGFPLGGTVMTLAYLRLAAGERWPMALAITAGTAAFFLLTSMLLNVPYPPGVVVQLLGR